VIKYTIARPLKRERWFTAIRYALESSPDASRVALEKLKELDDEIEREAGQELKSDMRRGN
jgi:hypothetical protein